MKTRLNGTGDHIAELTRPENSGTLGQASLKNLLRLVKSRFVPVRNYLFHRPRGLKHLGPQTFVARPWHFEGSGYIEIGSHVQIHGGSNICAIMHHENLTYTPSIRIGDGVYIGHHAFISAIDQISIGDGCVLSEHVYITDVFHGLTPGNGPILKQRLDSKGPVRIGANCFLGYRVAVMPGVELGEWCVVGSNSVVTRSFPACSMIAGAPARLIKVYSPESGKWIKPTTNQA